MKPVLIKWLRGATVVAAVAYFVVLLSWLYPYLKVRLSSGSAALEPSNKVKDWPEAAELQERLKGKFYSYKPEELKERRPQVSLDGTHPLTPLVEAVFLVSARPAEEPDPTEGQKPDKDQELVFEYRMLDVGIRADRLIWALAILAGIILFARDLWKQPGEPEAQPSAAARTETDLNFEGDLPKLLYKEACHYERLCSLTYARSTFLLRGAIITAIGGLGALNFLPDNAQEAANSNDLWSLLTRSYGVVLLVNAVALVLLRQYRTSAHDFLYMVNLRWRRMSTLAASLDASKREQVTKALLTEPYPEERLKNESQAEVKAPAEGDEMDGGILSTLKKAFKPEKEK
jgi:hypothetical protein